MLARLDKIEGVEKSLANHSGTMIRITLAEKTQRDRVAADSEKLLTEEKRKPERLSGEAFEEALTKEQWREAQRVGELSAIEFRTLVLRRLKTFAETEKLDQEKTDKLLKIAEEEWDRMAKDAADDTTSRTGSEKAEPPGATEKSKSGDARPARTRPDRTTRGGQFAAAVSERAKELLTEEQLERLKHGLSVERK